MLLKSVFFTVYTLSFNFYFYFFLALTALSYYFLFVDLRRKFISFILIVIFYSIWGFNINLDGMMLILLTAEFTIILLFLMTYLQLYSNYVFTTNKFSMKPIIFILCVVLGAYSPLNVFYSYTSYYRSLSHIVSSDFYILYFFLFEKLPLFVILITLIISFFSFFFIVAYYSLKAVKQTANKRLKNLYFLRKQNLIKQNSFNSKVYTFQN